jgi:DNA-binding transcriptional ArsR family regulator
MDINNALTVFDTLSQETRLKTFRYLIKAGPEGVRAGQIAAALKVPHNTMSFHLGHLAHSGLVSARKSGRSVIYSANYDAVRDLIEFIVSDCCSTSFASIREDAVSGCSVIELANCCPESK